MVASVMRKRIKLENNDSFQSNDFLKLGVNCTNNYYFIYHAHIVKLENGSKRVLVDLGCFSVYLNCHQECIEKKKIDDKLKKKPLFSSIEIHLLLKMYTFL